MTKTMFYPLAIAWIFSVAACLVVIERYANAEGTRAPADMPWPSGTSLTLAADRPTALIFAHPKCPCSQAAVQEFQRIEARHPAAFATTVVFTVPSTTDENWNDTRLVAQAGNLDAGIVFDAGGDEAGRFQAVVSGQVLLFAPDGRLLFSGGVTPARGHEGGNGGQEAFEYMLEHPAGAALSFPVFGCALVVERHAALDRTAE